MKQQISKLIFLNFLNVMKNTLDLLAFKLTAESKEYLYLKKNIMDFTYNSLTKIYKSMESEKIIKKCPNKCSLRKGYSSCDCGGSGYINAD
jgi:hypothetical protein